jgi:hypothetical protein
MPDHRGATWFMAQETRALLARLARVKPFVLYETMVPAAALLPASQIAIEQFLAQGRQELRDRAHAFLLWLGTREGQLAPPAEAQRRFTLLRLRFNDLLSQLDTFADVLTQRSEHETGVWLSGLDVAAADALVMPEYYTAPPVICYLDRGHGAAIRRARTRLPGGGESPVAIIRVPRERMVGSGIASSLVHEVGHQGSALLDLVGSIGPILRGLQRGDARQQLAWHLWERWISEIVADFWALAKVGITSTLGLMGIVSLPSAFVFRMSLDDPHPIPWIRVKLSCAIGKALYPHPQWDRLSGLWESFYPPIDLSQPKRDLLALLEEMMPSFVTLLVNHRPKSLRGQSLREALISDDRRPENLAACYRSWSKTPQSMRQVSPTLVFAAIGQARADGQITPELEAKAIGNLLTDWAVRSTLDVAAQCASPSRRRSRAIAPVSRETLRITTHQGG